MPRIWYRGGVPSELNKKALAEILFYYLDLKYNEHKNCVKRLIVTDFQEWFVFESTTIDNILDKHGERLFRDFHRGEEGTLFNTDPKTSVFYNAVHKYLKEHPKLLEQLWHDCLHFSLEDREPFTQKLYKVFSLEFLYCKPAIRQKALDERFYHEILHIMGLRETIEDGSKKILRLPVGERDSGSFIEQTNRLLLRRGKHENFEVSLELVLTWFNRILFFKLLEAQLRNWHKDQSGDYHFFSLQRIKDFSIMDGIFLEVLSTPLEQRDSFWNDFRLVPFMNSSLFTASELEKKTDVFLSAISTGAPNEITMYENSVLRTASGKRYEKGTKLPTLEYLIRFLNSYDFGKKAEGDEFYTNTQTVINPAVLGLLFEKLNGYKDGSYYTPSFVTEFMADKAIEHGIVHNAEIAFNESFKDLNDLKNFVGRDDEKLDKLRDVIDTYRIVDPAVGSGHFLVSCLNKLVKVKYDCRLIKTKSGELLNNLVNLKIEDDTLLITDSDSGKEFIYNPNNDNSQQIQETLFREKLRIIEDCLFGVDINSKAVIICRLRLWIELLKNAFYHEDEKKNKVLQVMPNLDMNIRDGNSLISSLTVIVDEPPSNIFFTNEQLNSYKDTVRKYKNASGHDNRKKIEKQIAEIKNELKIIEPQGYEKDLQFFEWSFEFPEVLNEDGAFRGFDLIIANPPYISAPDQIEDIFLSNQRHFISESKCFEFLYQKWDLYVAFLDRALQLCSKNGAVMQIVPYRITDQNYGQKFREKMVEKYRMLSIADLTEVKVFDEATVDNCIVFYDKNDPKKFKTRIYELSKDRKFSVAGEEELKNLETGKSKAWKLSALGKDENKISSTYRIGDFCYISKGMVLHSEEKNFRGEFCKDELISDTRDEIHSRPYLEAKFISPYRVNTVKYLEWGTERCPKKISRPTFSALYQQPKLICNRTGKLQVVYDESTHYLHNDSAISLVKWIDLKDADNKSIANSIKKFSNGKTRKKLEEHSTKISLKFLLGLLNSRVGAALLAQERAGDYHIYPEHVRNIPVILPEKEQLERIESLVDSIMEEKTKGNDATETEKLLEQEYVALYAISTGRSCHP